MSIRISGLLLVAFIVLRLTEVINWSWWWVLSLAWIPLGAAAIFFGIVYIFGNRGAAKTPEPK